MTETTEIRPSPAKARPEQRWSGERADGRQGGGRMLPVLGFFGVFSFAAGVVLLMMQGAIGLPVALLLFGLLATGAVAAGAFASGRSAAPASRDTVVLAAALESDPVPVAVTGASGRLVAFNAAYKAASERETPPPPERFFADDEEAASALYALARKARQGESGEITLNGGSGAVTDVTVRPLSVGMGVGEGSEAASGAVWRFDDATERLQHEDRLQSRADDLSSVIEAAPFGVYLASADGRLLASNRTLKEMAGIDPDTVPDDLAAFGLPRPQLPAADKEPGDIHLAVQSLDLRRGDGGALPARHVTALRYGAGGRPERLHGLVFEDRTGSEEDVRYAAQRRYSRFFNAAPIGLVVMDADGVIETANGTFAGLVPARTVQSGTPLSDYIAEADREKVASALKAALSGEAGAMGSDILMEGDGERVVRFYASRGGDGDDGRPQLLGYLVETTDQKSLELQFAQSQKMQAVGQLAGGIAHDFNNLLTAIIGFCDLLLASHPAGDPSFADIMQIKQNATRAANLTRQLLAFSRRQTLRPKVLSLTDALADLSHLLARLLGETVELKIVHGRDLGLVKVDQNQLEQVIVNLAVNARDAMSDGGRLTIRTANVSEEDSRALDHSLMPAADYVLIEVADTGCGIAKEHLGQIFEPFFTTKDVNKGTGLGLSTVYGIVKQTGGYIFPYSTVGKGTTFRIYLPRHHETEEEALADVNESRLEADLTGKGTILLVEDEDAVRTFAARALSTRGYDVLEAENGEVALEVVDEHDGPIDLVVSDVVMPNMDGPALFKRLREIRPDVKVVFVSGYAEDAFKNSLDTPEDFVFLPKPFSLKQLAQTVKETIASTGG